MARSKPVIKAHGSSHAKGIKNAIRQAKLCVANDLCGTMQTALAAVAEKAEAESRACKKSKRYRTVVLRKA